MTGELTRRRLLQAAGATVAAGYLTTQTATAETKVPRLKTYPIPAGIAQATTFEVKVRTAPGPWQSVSTYSVNLKEINAKTGSGKILKSSMAYFDFAGPVEVMVTYTKGTINTARIRPLAEEIQPAIDGSTLKFTLTDPRKLVIEVNGEIFDCLHLLTRPIEVDAPDPNDPDVIYFGPGVHTTATGEVLVPSGKTVYLAGGAVLKAGVTFKNVANAALAGRGLIYGTKAGGCTIVDSKNIRVDGISMLDLVSGYAITAGQSEQVSITDFGYFSAGQWGDGIDIFSSSEILIDNSFLRCSDDCIALYTHRWDYYGDTRNVTISNSSLWADVAHPINVGTHGNTDKPETIENLVFSNIDVLDHREPQMDYQGCIALNPGDSNLVKNVRAQDIRVEDFRWGQLINMRVMFNKTYNTSVGRGIDGVYIKNLSYNGTHANPAIMVGYDADHAINNVTFQNLVINGKFIGNGMKKPGWYKFTDMMPAYANEHVLNMRFLNSTDATSTNAPQITSPAQTAGTKNQVFNYLITASELPTSFSAEGLPKGLDIDTGTGLISGVMRDNVGSFDVTVSATNSVGTATQTVALTVQHP